MPHRLTKLYVFSGVVFSPVIAGLTRNPLWCFRGLWFGDRNDSRGLNKYAKLNDMMLGSKAQFRQNRIDITLELSRS